MTARTKLAIENRIAANPAEIAGMVGLSVDAIRAAISSGDLQAHRHGRRILIPIDAARAWIATLPSVATPAQ